MENSDSNITVNGFKGWQITGSNIGTDTIIGFKRLEFNDGTLALDIDPGDTAGQAYRLYQAAFARTPDMPGVAYHMNDMENNGLVLWNIANNFLASPEFKSKYGENPHGRRVCKSFVSKCTGKKCGSCCRGRVVSGAI